MAECEQLPVGQARSGSPEAWDVLFRRFQRPLYSYVFELVHHEQTTLDVIQETFINAIRHIGGLRDDAKFAGWLFGIAHQKCVQRWRRRDRDAALREELDGVAPEPEEGPDDLLIRREREEAFMSLLHELPPPQRAVLLLRFIEDFSLEEIAVITETPLGTVKSRLHHAKRALRRRLEETP